MHRIQLVPPAVTPIEKLAVKMKDYLAIPDPGPLYTLMGAVAANMIQGNPVWLMLVGPPSCGKTELLNSLLGIPNMVEAAEISSEASFLSGTPAKDRANNATGGLLRQVGDYGGMVVNDFTSILSKSSDKVATIMAVFRECFSGRWNRHVGSDGGRHIHWNGRLSVFAGVTNRIDRHLQLSNELGERWVYFRFDEREGWTDCIMAMDDTRSPRWRDELRLLVSDFFKELDMSFETLKPRREYTMGEKLRLFRLSQVVARCRSAVARDSYSKEVVGPRETEMETRLFTVFAQVLLGMDYIGVPESLRWRLLTKVGMDSMPVLRKLIIQAASRNPISIKGLVKVVGCDVPVVKRLVRDLEIQQVLEVAGDIVSLSPWMNEHYKKLNHEGLTLVLKMQQLL